MNKKKKSRLKKVVYYIVMTLLLVVGLGLIFNSQIKSYWINFQAQQKVESITKSEVKKGQQKKADYNAENVKAISDSSYVESQQAKKENAIGKITIKDLKINLPIFKGLNTENLTIGAGTMKEDQEMGKGNYTLAGHHMQDPKVLFSPLSKAKKGQIVEMTDLTHKYKYKISDVKIVPETEVSVIDDVPGKTELTLVTCASGNPGETRRLIVTADLVK